MHFEGPGLDISHSNLEAFCLEMLTFSLLLIVSESVSQCASRAGSVSFLSAMTCTSPREMPSHPRTEAKVITPEESCCRSRMVVLSIISLGGRPDAETVQMGITCRRIGTRLEKHTPRERVPDRGMGRGPISTVRMVHFPRTRQVKSDRPRHDACSALCFFHMKSWGLP